MKRRSTPGATSRDETGTRMRAVVVHGAGDLRVEDRPRPTAGRGEALVRVAFGGICGSDLHSWQDGRNGEFSIRAPLVLGHELVGTVEALGSGAGQGLEVGTRVVVHPATPCPTPGETTPRGLHLDPAGRYLGSAATSPHTDGGFSEFVVVARRQLRPILATVPMLRAVLAEPLAVALHGVGRAGDLRGSRVLVTGCGPIGTLAIAALRHRGATEIHAADLRDPALRIAVQTGADRTFALASDAPPAASYDLVVEASGAIPALRTALRVVRSGGTIVQLGMLPPGDATLPLGSLVSREIALLGCQRFELELDDAVELLAAAPELDAVIARSFAIDEAEQAFAAAADATIAGKVVLQLGSGSTAL